MYRQGRQKKTIHPTQPLSSPDPSQRRRQIKLLCDTIAREFHPDKIVLLGSYASGNPHADSDVNLLITMSFTGSPFRQASLILNHIVQTIGVLPIDILVRMKEQVRERMQTGDSFMLEIIEHGKVMYEANHA